MERKTIHSRIRLIWGWVIILFLIYTKRVQTFSFSESLLFFQNFID